LTIDISYLLSKDNPDTYRKMLAHLFDTIDDLLYAEENDFPPWSTIEKFLTDVPVDNISIQLGVGILSITLPIRGMSQARRIFCSKFREKITLTESPDRVESLLSGLE